MSQFIVLLVQLVITDTHNYIYCTCILVLIIIFMCFCVNLLDYPSNVSLSAISATSVTINWEVREVCVKCTCIKTCAQYNYHDCTCTCVCVIYSGTPLLRTPLRPTYTVHCNCPDFRGVQNCHNCDTRKYLYYLRGLLISCCV